ncbi:MAG: TetR/AcrR family transcriptional regulator [Ancrocorticia sp.]
MATADDDHRRRPRRRGAALVTAILEATIDELTENGYPALTMEAVAQRAGASKASLYRRWNTRAELVMDAVYRMAPMPEQIPDSGQLREDLLEVLRQTAATLEGPPGTALRGLLAESLADSSRIHDVRTRSQGRNRKLIAEVLRRAVGRGEISEAAVVPIRLEVGAALIRNQFLFRGEPLDEGLFVAIVDDVLLPLFQTPSDSRLFAR